MVLGDWGSVYHGGEVKWLQMAVVTDTAWLHPNHHYHQSEITH